MTNAATGEIVQFDNVGLRYGSDREVQIELRAADLRGELDHAHQEQGRIRAELAAARLPGRLVGPVQVARGAAPTTVVVTARDGRKRCVCHSASLRLGGRGTPTP